MPTLPRMSLVVLTLSVIGCGDSAEASRARKEIDEAIDATTTLTREKMTEMSEQLRQRWTDLTVEVDRLKAEAKARGGEARADLAEMIADIEAKAKAAGETLGEAAAASEAEFRESLDHAEDALTSAKQALQKAWQKLHG